MKHDRTGITKSVLECFEASKEDKMTIVQVAEIVRQPVSEIRYSLALLVYKKKLRCVSPGRPRFPAIYALWKPTEPYIPKRSPKEIAWLKLREQMDIKPIPDVLQR